MRPEGPARPWCFPCRAENCPCWAEHLGIACEWHFGILSEADQHALAEAVQRRHPRGGRVRSLSEQIVIVRMDLRAGDIPNRIEETWREDTAAYFADLEAEPSVD